MRDQKKKDSKKKDQKGSALGRRDLMKFGAGAAVAGILNAPAVAAQQAQAPSRPTGPLAPVDHSFDQHFPDIRESQEVITSIQPYYITKTQYGWKNDSGRAWGQRPYGRINAPDRRMGARVLLRRHRCKDHRDD